MMRQLYSVSHNLRTNDETAIQCVAQSEDK